MYTPKYNVDANLSASDNVISGNEPSSAMLTNQSQKPGRVYVWIYNENR